MHLWVKKLNLFIFTHTPKQNSPPGRWKLPIPPELCFLKIFLPEQKGGGEEGLWSWKNKTKQNKGIGHNFW